MDEVRRVQQVGKFTLTVSIPRDYAKRMGLSAKDTLLVREDVDGTLRLIPTTRAREAAKATLKADQAGSKEMLTMLVVGAYAMGYDTIEVSGKEPLDHATVDQVLRTIKRLRGMEVVESDERRIVAQSFMDPTKFPVDSLVKRLQILVSRSLEHVMSSLELRQTAGLNEVSRIQEEIDELYWLILRQLLVALSRRELASEIGIESPLHASGNRVSAKTLDEIGGIIQDAAEELVRLRKVRAKRDPKVTASMQRLAAKTREAFNTTVESLLAPDIMLIGRSLALVEETMQLEKQIMDEILSTAGSGYSRVLVSYFGQLARYCNIIIEISSHRLLRKTSRVVTVQER
ncbi:MAG: phosphate uptake regulator PhoU [Nitrososphaerota archaeon]|jgi:phosphate uptake regulator|nr:phosphate uptake regulator PhoU [Nitrososphaerota archaeon]MDG6953103.1 phosphate uptake regulator PhoU [Nitrososphaerota archaeon]MDG6956206.1 phosphate uptake regulator PhoU [Nitrososphaerota archaeon]MDG6958817.1 phosphate uptake regulator PhoU [Nitrososphaerota archaeon]MDG6960427.1 phosphate uptake regulator PhoU [Nitrososphaerota archaeon]